MGPGGVFWALGVRFERDGTLARGTGGSPNRHPDEGKRVGVDRLGECAADGQPSGSAGFGRAEPESGVAARVRQGRRVASADRELAVRELSAKFSPMTLCGEVRVAPPLGPLGPPQPHRPPPPQWQPAGFQAFYQPICSFHRASANVLSRTTEAGTATEMHADVAQLVAHHLAKVRVAGSNPVIRSRGRARQTSFAVPLRTVEWPSGEATACKAVHTGSIPVSTSRD